MSLYSFLNNIFLDDPRAIISILLAGFAGYLFEGNVNEYFISDGPFQWLNAGITNFRGVYWEVERDTLIAIPLFIFMGIMLEKSKIAEDKISVLNTLSFNEVAMTFNGSLLSK